MSASIAEGLPVVVHVGYHKTATSWLQKTVFPVLQGVHYREQTVDVTEQLVSVNPFAFDRDATRERLLDGASADEVALISCERLSGHPSSAGYDSRVLADRLHEVFPGAKVIITIRRQPEMVRACYTEYVRQGGAESLRRFLRPPMGTHRQLPHFDLRYLEYHHLIGYYQELFGSQRVLVLAYEQLRESHEDFVGRLVDFMGVEPPGDLDIASVNRSLSPLVLGLRRRTNLIFSRDASNPTGLIDNSGLANFVGRRYRSVDRWLSRSLHELGEVRMKTLIDDACRGRFAESNDQTSELTGLPLTGLGYDTTAATTEARDRGAG